MQESQQHLLMKITGDGSSNWVLTRTPDADAANELTAGAFTFTGGTGVDTVVSDNTVQHILLN